MSSSDKLKIPLQEISLATNGFAEANIIGRGGYGVVYQGQSKRGMLAIKRLNRVHGQGHHEYGMEITVLSKYKHENLVSLIGFCGENGEKILVYKYEANKSLDKFLHTKDLSWMRRLHICMGAARGLRYLHNETGSEHVVLHRDIKSSNILLDENWNAKALDFGLSKIALTNSANSVVFTNPCGTQGYVDPQVLFGGLTQKSDVYSFGVVLFEVLFGKLVAIQGYLGDGCFTVEMAKKHYEEKTLDMMIDPDLRNEMGSDSLSTFSTIAYQCLKKRTEDRPTMSLVVEALEKALGYQVDNARNSFLLSCLSSKYMHDVYISFEIEGYTLLVDHLCRALKREGLSTYKANFTTSPSKAVHREAIKQSVSFIIVFSKNIAASSWKLDEVVEIIKCVKERGNFLVPVFFDVDPSDLREQKGHFGQVSAVSRYESDPRMGVWRNALIEATNIPGLQYKDFTHPTDLANEAVERITRQLLRLRWSTGKEGYLRALLAILHNIEDKNCLKIRTEDRSTMISSVVEALEKALGYQEVGSARESYGLSSSSSAYVYDVYISSETDFSSSSIVDYLCRALKRGLSIYLTKKEVHLEAIKQSVSFIICFSENIADSYWKLDEVAEIIKCVKERGGVLLPIFHFVTEQKGYFATNMSRYDSIPIPREGVWRKTLVEIANFPGLRYWDFKHLADIATEAAARIKRQLLRLKENLDADLKRWSFGKEGNLRALLSTLHYILEADSGWQPVPLSEILTTSEVAKAYGKAILCVHPYKLKQRVASIQQEYICEKVFDLIKAAWNCFNSEER